MPITITQKKSVLRRRGGGRPLRQATPFVGAALIGLLGLTAPGAAHAQGSPKTDRSIKAQDFVNTFGVNVHLGDANYQNVLAVADALNIIGFSHVRIECRDEQSVARVQDLAAKAAPYFPAGLKTDVLLVGYNNAPDDTLAKQEALILKLAPLVESVEGPNEINNVVAGDGTHGPFDTTDQTKNFPSNYVAWSKALFAWKKTVPALSKARLLAPDIASGDPADYAKLPNVSSYVNSGSFHFYAGNGRQPSNFGGGNFSAIYNWYKAAAAPTKPVSITEWGQTTAGKPGQGGCDNATQAKYILNQMFDIASKGVYRAYLYQIMDGTDGDPTGNEGSEAHFGIFDYQWQVKPAAQALANVKNLLHDPTANFTPKVPAYHVSGVTDAGAAGSSLSISKSDGSTFIVVWNEPQIWDPSANAPVTPAADPVTVSFGGSYTYKVYDPLRGISSIAAGSASSITVNLTGSPLLIQVFPH
ncbi:MAG: hypothetical protein ACRYFS_26850 [Janthinobacterium lividum]